VKLLFYAADRFDAARALSVGLVGQVVPKAELEAIIRDLAHRISVGAPLTITAAKRAINAASGASVAFSDAELQALADACYQSEDYAEGRKAFKDKRKPLFKGR
jgi:enoyl-CoA hydratase/carnithine racemase